MINFNFKKWITQRNSIEILKILQNRCNCYLVRKDNFNVLIDTSIRYEESMILSHLNKLNIEKLHCIMLTHSHLDHAGNAQILLKKFKSNVFIHSSELKYLKEGYSDIPKGTLPITKLLTSIVGKRIMSFQRYPSCDSDKIFTEENFYENSPDILKIQILATPGHSSGSVNFIIDNEIALVGDTMVNRKGNIYPPFADFPELLLEAWKKLLDTKSRLFLPAHGREIERTLLESEYMNINKK